MFIIWLGKEFEALQMIVLPGTMRSVIFILWTMYVIFPISSALQEVQITQWKIIMSHNVSTRERLIGICWSKRYTLCLLIVFLAPVVVTPFATVFHVSILGQSLIYRLLFLIILGAMIFSVIITTIVDVMFGNLILKVISFNSPIIIIGTIVCAIGTRRLVKSEIS